MTRPSDGSGGQLTPGESTCRQDAVDETTKSQEIYAATPSRLVPARPVAEKDGDVAFTCDSKPTVRVSRTSDTLPSRVQESGEGLLQLDASSRAKP